MLRLVWETPGEENMVEELEAYTVGAKFVRTWFCIVEEKTGREEKNTF